MRVLVTGGCGFIGSRVVDRLLDHGHATRIFDVLGRADERARCETVVGDLLDPHQITAAAAGCDVIIHLAAAADVGLVAKDPAGSEALNSRGTLNVLEAARAAGRASDLRVDSRTPRRDDPDATTRRRRRRRRRPRRPRRPRR